MMLSLALVFCSIAGGDTALFTEVEVLEQPFPSSALVPVDDAQVFLRRANDASFTELQRDPTRKGIYQTTAITGSKGTKVYVWIQKPARRPDLKAKNKQVKFAPHKAFDFEQRMSFTVPVDPVTLLDKPQSAERYVWVCGPCGGYWLRLVEPDEPCVSYGPYVTSRVSAPDDPPKPPGPPALRTVAIGSPFDGCESYPAVPRRLRSGVDFPVPECKYRSLDEISLSFRYEEPAGSGHVPPSMVSAQGPTRLATDQRNRIATGEVPSLIVPTR